jgi:hypothetical protein
MLSILIANFASGSRSILTWLSRLPRIICFGFTPKTRFLRSIVKSVDLKFPFPCPWTLSLGIVNTAISIKVVHEQSGKVEYERKGCWELLWKFINLLAIPSSLSRSYSTLLLCSWTTLIEIAVYNIKHNTDNNKVWTQYNRYDVWEFWHNKVGKHTNVKTVPPCPDVRHVYVMWSWCTSCNIFKMLFIGGFYAGFFKSKQPLLGVLLRQEMTMRSGICSFFVVYNFIYPLKPSLCTAVTLDEARERTSVSWIHNPPSSGHVDSSQIWGPASDWTVLYLNNLWQIKLFHWLIDN